MSEPTPIGKAMLILIDRMATIEHATTDDGARKAASATLNEVSRLDDRVRSVVERARTHYATLPVPK